MLLYCIEKDTLFQVSSPITLILLYESLYKALSLVVISL